LHRATGEEELLQASQQAGPVETLYGGDIKSLCLEAKHQAGIDWSIVD
jgi:hypothetical protein